MILAIGIPVTFKLWNLMIVNESSGSLKAKHSVPIEKTSRFTTKPRLIYVFSIGIEFFPFNESGSANRANKF